MVLLDAAEIVQKTAEHVGVPGAHGVDWTTVILSIVGIITGGAGLKWFNAWTQKKREDKKDGNADNLAFRENLLQRISEMNKMILGLQEKMFDLVAVNARLEAELKAAHDEISQLRAEIKVLSTK